MHHIVIFYFRKLSKKETWKVKGSERVSVMSGG